MDLGPEVEEIEAGRIARRMLRALELTSALVIGLDASGLIRLFSPGAEQATGYGREDVLGTSFLDALVPETMQGRYRAVLGPVIGDVNDGREIVEGAIRCRAGELRYVRWLVAQDPRGRDNDVVLFLVGQDVTESRERDRRALREKLAATGNLVAGLAHELRNPLNGAHLHATLLERSMKRAGIDDEEIVGAVRVMQGELHRLSQLLSDFLDFARPLPLEIREAPLRAVCERALGRVAELAARSGVEMRSELPGGEIAIDIDAARIELAVVNLLQNAIEAAGAAPGGVTTLRAKLRGEGAIVEVEDNGPGLLDSEAPIFDPFYSTKPGGTGLGLAIVQRAAADHDGIVELETSPGKTLLRLRLPPSLPGARSRRRKRR